jgi:hypothetical protein
VRWLVGETGAKAELGEDLHGPLTLLALGDAMGEQHGEHDVFQRREWRQEVKRLKDVADMPGAEPISRWFRQRHDIRPLDPDVPSRWDSDTPDQIEQRCLSRPTWPV